MCIIAAGCHHLGRSGLRVPEHELREIRTRHIGKALDELLDSCRLSIVSGEVEVHGSPEIFRTEQRLEHADHFGALLVYGRRIEIVDLVVEHRPHRMCKRARILDELLGAQAAHIADALDRPRAHVGGKLLVAKDRESLLEAELEPIAAGDAVAGPVVKVFVSDNRLDALEIVIGRALWRREHVFVIEDIEALVLHCPHVEIGHRNDHEHVEIVFAAEGGLVPTHRALEGVHCVAAAALLVVLYIDAKGDLATRHGAKAIRDAGELAADHRKQVRGLGKRIMPDGEMAVCAGDVAGGDKIAVGEEH